MRTASRLLFLLVLLPLASAAITIRLDVADSFSAGETISFNYTLVSADAVSVTYSPFVRCPDAPVQVLTERTVDLKAGAAFTGTYTDIAVDESLEPQECNAGIVIMSPMVQTEERAFSIDTMPSFSLNISVCESSSCPQQSRTFVLGDTLRLSYAPETGISVASALIGPNGNRGPISLPTSLELKQPGNYRVEATASKQGFKNMGSSVTFAVLERGPEIRDARMCNADGTCGAGEDFQNCPQDCPRAEANGAPKRGADWALYIMIIAAVSLVAVFLFKKRRG